MDRALDLHSYLLIAGFLLLVGMSAWHRLRLEREVRALPEEVRERLGWARPGQNSRSERRRIARRLVMRGLPDWVPLSEAARRDLRWHRAFGLGAGLFLIIAPAAAWGVWILVPVLGLPAIAILAIHAWLDGPWEAAP